MEIGNTLKLFARKVFVRACFTTLMGNSVPRDGQGTRRDDKIPIPGRILNFNPYPFPSREELPILHPRPCAPRRLGFGLSQLAAATTYKIWIA